MLKKTISLFVIGLALAGCGNVDTGDDGAIGDNDNRMEEDVREETNENANPGIPEVGDVDVEGNRDGYERDDDGGVNGNNGTNGEGDQGELDGNVEEPNTDGINRTQDGDGMNSNRS